MKWFTIAVVLFLACEGPTGPPGEDGADGTKGLDGTNGLDGTDGVANISIVEFTVLSTSWINSTSDNEIYYYHENISSITSNVVDNGVVLVQISSASGVWWALPHTNTWDFDDDWVVDYSETFTYAYAAGLLEVSVSQTTSPLAPSTRYFKAIIIPPAN